MYKKLAVFLTNKFIKTGIIESSQRDVYQYGFEILLSHIAYIIVFFTLAVLTQTFVCSLLFGIAFFVTRLPEDITLQHIQCVIYFLC